MEINELTWFLIEHVLPVVVLSGLHLWRSIVGHVAQPANSSDALGFPSDQPATSWKARKEIYMTGKITGIPERTLRLENSLAVWTRQNLCQNQTKQTSDRSSWACSATSTLCCT